MGPLCEPNGCGCACSCGCDGENGCCDCAGAKPPDDGAYGAEERVDPGEGMANGCGIGEGGLASGGARLRVFSSQSESGSASDG